MDTNAIIRDITQYVDQHGGQHVGYGWYAGIASDPDDRLFQQHKVDRQSAWIHCLADSDQSAREAEAYLHRIGYKGGGGGGSYMSTTVYAYKITPTTVEDA